ncbi:MAG: NADH-quinone oxidoreductase subunit L [Anaeromyxobacteraceae bacterium]
MPPVFASPVAAESYLWAIILFPLFGAGINALLGRRLGKGNAAFIAVAVMVASFVFSLAAFSHTLNGTVLHYAGPPWIQVAGPDGRALISVTWGLLVDRLSGTMIMVVTGVGTLIHIYSISYMSHEDEQGFAKFFTYLNLFVSAMLILVLGDSLILTFVGWEGVGLCSYLLIGFWYTDPAKAFAGRKAFVTNRVGDFGFLVGVFVLVALFGTVSYGDLQAKAVEISAYVKQGAVIDAGLFAGWTWRAALTLALIGLFVGATGKSAQLPLYIWLPDAMAGPTPVSALIHAATMVTAGVYLVARNNYLFSLSPAAMAVVTLVGALTALVAALIAFTQNDLKKVLAYSTVSQLGFMFIGVGVGAWWAGILHLVTHAFFKACLFLGAGSVMHGMGDKGDIRIMGGLRKKMPHTTATFLIATAAITGIVPLAGFWSKDAILGNALFSRNHALGWVGPVAYGLGAVAALGTAFYMTRLIFLVFFGAPRSHDAEHAHESSPVMTGPLWVLAILAIVGAGLELPLHGQWGHIYKNFTARVFEAGTQNLLTAHHFHAVKDAVTGALTEAAHPSWPYFAAWAIALAGTLVAWAMYLGPLKALPSKLAIGSPNLYKFAYEKFRVDEAYEFLIIKPLNFFAWLLWRVVDVFAIDGILVMGTARAVGAIGRVMRGMQTGDIQWYAALMAVAAAVILFNVLGVGGL